MKWTRALPATGQQSLDGAADVLHWQDSSRIRPGRDAGADRGGTREWRRRTPADTTNAPSWPPPPAGLAPPPGLPIARKVRVGVVVAVIIAGMLVLMRAINAIEDGLHGIHETGQQ
jgi:hypothetical protein